MAFYVPFGLRVLIAIGLILFWVMAWLVNQHLGGDVR